MYKRLKQEQHKHYKNKNYDMNEYYVYFHINPLKNEVFYVGKGKGNRAYQKYNRNKHWNNVVNKYGYIVDIVENGLTNEQALEKEKFYIRFIGRDKLTNMTDGGEGYVEKRSDETKKKMSLAQMGNKKGLGHKKSDEVKRIIGESSKGRNVGRVAWNKGLKSKSLRDEKGRFISKK